MMKKIFLAGFLILLFAGCASNPSVSRTGGLPDWVENPDALYPKSLYLTAVSSGSSLDEARQRSIGSLSNIFSVNVKLDRRILEAYSEEKKRDAEMDWEHSVNLFNRSVLTSDNELINVRTGKTYFDERTATFYVLSVISKAETEMLYLEEIQKNDRSLVSFYREAELAENKISKLIYLKKCMEVIKIGEALRSIHRILSLTGDTPALPVPKDKIQVELQNLKNTIVAKIETAGSEKEKLSSYLREVVDQIGFSTGEENPDIIVKGNLDITPLDFPREGKFVRWELIVDVTNATTGNTMNTYTASAREGHVSGESVKGRALDRVKEELNNNFYENFAAFLSKSYE
ncbi:MAG: hypothetical protein P8Y62_02910 [candidate division WOR-3 bacterium]|jgi:hypothetical protein